MDDKILNTIICGDCLDIMRDMPDDSVDLVLTDPPYGIGIDGSKEHISKGGFGVQVRKAYDFKGWDNEIPPKEYFEQLFRVSKNQIIFGANYFTEYLPAGKKGWIIWDKGQRGLTMSDCEIIFTSFSCPTRIETLHRTHLWQEKPQHPTQKPQKLLRPIIEKHSNEADLIFDCFCGSGSTCVAAKRLGRNYIGVDISEEYCQIARDRLAAEEAGLTVKEMKVGQLGLFEKKPRDKKQ